MPSLAHLPFDIYRQSPSISLHAVFKLCYPNGPTKTALPVWFNGKLSLQHSASVPSIHPHGDTELSMVEDKITTKQLAAIEHLEELHYDEVAGLQATLSDHAKELSNIRSKLAKATNRGKGRRKSAKERAQSRDAEIISLREELANQKQCNNTIKIWAAEAERAMVDMQQHVNCLTFQLNSMRDQRE
ncbi:hypothetical protein CIHG_07981 [Coccidioides immitis H538.4]|uniref:Uncharacterized protein n=3 Tax=Coccidioides immitis TaxID=5501 RepID=A0A0J8QV45_COCIT|nr:hypothetical protein CIRG_08953 [Coccidioides immitis RMSCC 2394]KMU75133.1 hypothetical protein CISG_04420 [Coccidioides immitis RMSCC 3703]KMU90171.1 hypothetical protein CIHG_07981 [Coccidioides immitis H538.4]